MSCANLHLNLILLFSGSKEAYTHIWDANEDAKHVHVMVQRTVLEKALAHTERRLQDTALVQNGRDDSRKVRELEDDADTP